MGFLDVKQESAGAANLQVAECERQMSSLFQRKQELLVCIGQIYADSNDAAATVGTAYEEPLKEIEKIKEELIILEKRKLAVQGMRKCEKCGNILVLDSAFCNKCGERLAELFIPTEENPRICAKCGAPYNEGTKFCTRCGNKLG